MFFFLITCLSFFCFCKYSLPLKPLPAWAHEMRLLSMSAFQIKKSIRSSLAAGAIEIGFSKMSMKMMNSSNFKAEEGREEETSMLLELPELILDCIFERLPADGLCTMASVCRAMRERCTSDRLWRRHISHKWGRIIGPSAHRHWYWHLASAKDCSGGFQRRGGGSLIVSLSRLWPLSLITSNLDNAKRKKTTNLLPIGSVMSLYIALETGKFSFPAQVYNRENGHVGFMLSCYDAELCYDPRTDTFQARYPPHGRRPDAIENGVSWDRIRAPPIDTSPHDLHISDCLDELRPGDHFEIQWRRNKEFPYGWWYGVVGHLESCNGNDNYCFCHQSDTVVLEFNQYSQGSQWRRTSINRRHHREEGNEADGFYGGIRKLCSEDEITTWRRLWPSVPLE
ncbi:F-box protein At2g32560 [Diospyros lotus]|uniref:F-box protein At2g32560 n=1 Tax=Diospyros lotus TaxID=55363 RepID=UPI0022514C46|nr:F-box protein At2g32560 [Diospyros lotus]